ncbi:MAG: SDR family oxidoreductase [Planctomycetaceae bacterium]|nr:SDR family oxidoreductase [Planctomycetales bacterium]MCB9927483.1 SDR family oxidoreductase [Planctomycetaceae bacterium]
MRKTILVVGGTGGIGGAISRAFAADGLRVIATGLRQDEVESFRMGSETIETRSLDVTNAADVDNLVGSLTRLDVLINAAGVILRQGAEHEPEAFDRVLAVNLSGTMRLCSSCKPLLVASGGSVVNVASMLSFFGSGRAPAYSASKGGVAQLTKSLAIAWAPEGVRVNAIAPGWIETPLTEPLVNDPVLRNAIVERTPMRRWGQPEEVTGAVKFLCSSAAAFITGVVLPVDGGYSIA